MNAGTILIIDAVIVIGLIVVFGHRLIKNYYRKIQTPDAYMIQNVQSGLVIRPQNAEIADCVPIIQYTPKNWECTTWQMIGIGNNEYLLKDLYTQKSFAPVGEIKAGALLEQRPIGNDQHQHWIFERQTDDKYSIRLADSNLFITSVGGAVDERITLQTETNSANQLWTLHQQNPII
ncbi:MULTISPECIES: RICIN domain-containing protein [Lactiplantibacillus]|uniref:RICIN domain-containing protein n=1 Tax=Lactiplantibacillus TaxID=2767842 RepID=UPI000EA89F9E|nr:MULTISPECIES: RICIN domain-containing protein [Lactiplantibacillus]AYG38834.1 hypothetical protein CFK27_13250 [Lactiplantibacillus pentosus]AYG41493.1 hypothetical protein CFI14_10400 [Lactiplantibacillus pentosus]MBU7448072.1 RICIN domain-containing protein [Lactiplantibacillus sp. 7.2.4]MBU7480521.1 RICIN domain-containing protein [Lactiplantibacillus pentosus]MBU7501930.1 RICIN domain-containing protein [Lactiplantibacillus pentosus]